MELVWDERLWRAELEDDLPFELPVEVWGEEASPYFRSQSRIPRTVDILLR